MFLWGRFLTFSGGNNLSYIESLFRYRANTRFLNPRRSICYFVLAGRFKSNLTIGHSSIAPIGNSVVKNLSSYSSQRDSFKSKLWRVVKGIFTFTGGIFWITPVFLYGGYMAGFIHVDVEERDSHSQRVVERSEFQSRMLAFYNIHKEEDVETRARELRDKDYAFMKLWAKLRSEEGVLKRFGKPVRLSGFQVPVRLVDKTVHDIPSAKSEDRKSEAGRDQGEEVWKACCYVEGPQKSGVLDVEFTWVNDEWIPVSLQLEGLQKSGDVICNVSAPLPNGLTRFTRLSNDY